jgi:hypothetical protein
VHGDVHDIGVGLEGHLDFPEIVLRVGVVKGETDEAATTACSCRASSAEMPVAAANTGRRPSTSGSALASLSTVAFTLDTAKGDLKSGSPAAAFGVRSPGTMLSRPAT